MTGLRLSIGVALILVIAGGGYVGLQISMLRVNVPEYRDLGTVVLLDQNWTNAQRNQFHYTAQGSRVLPYRWFMALEQPCFSLPACQNLADSRYLQRFGFLPGTRDAELNPDGLPIGLAWQRDFTDPETKQQYAVVGYTCSTCHTGALRYGKYSVLVEGAPANIHFIQFQRAIGLSLLFTKYFPFRYARFEKRVLGTGASVDAKAALRRTFDRLLSTALAEKKAVDKAHVFAYAPGFGRLDALTGIVNQTFADDMKNFDNLRQWRSGVRFPQIWDSSWFTWVQYNASISSPFLRDIGQALGVRAAVKLYGSDAKQFENSVNVPNIRRVEELLYGPAQFQGLRAPKWPSIFPPLDRAKVARGAVLYSQHCQGCHLPPIDDLLADLHSQHPAYWWKNRLGAQFLSVPEIPVDVVGTDPNEAVDFMRRTVAMGDLGGGRQTAANALEFVAEGIRASFFRDKQLTRQEQIWWNGYRDLSDRAQRVDAIYKARPLDGIWTVAPFLHNASVPNLYELLSPVSEREVQFWAGNREFDPVRVGYATRELQGASLYDTKGPGNSNKGHEFNDKSGPGIIGPLISTDDRWALIEYLKSL